MLKSVVLIVACFILSPVFSQEKVQWAFSYDANTKELVMKATIDDTWHVYSQNVDPAVGPVPTEFKFTTYKGVKLIGKPAEPTPTTVYDENFEGDVLYFSDEVHFRQKVKVKKGGEVKGVVTYMVCDDHMCLPPVDVEFSINIVK